MTPRIANESTIQEASRLLHQGRLVAFPTETVYGLGADASNPEAVQRIFTAKGRPSDHPLIVHIADKTHLSDWATNIPEAAWQLAEQFWPGPLAIILQKQPHIPLAVTGGQQTVGLRVPNHPVALALLQTFKGGIAAPSANRFCRISPTQAQHVVDELGDNVDLVLDGGACQVGVESTIVDLSGVAPRLLRPGHISAAQIEAVLQTDLLIPQQNKQPTTSDIRAPGMMALHYAPLTTTLLCLSDCLPTAINKLSEGNKKIGLLLYRSALTPTHYMPVLRMPNTLEGYAQQLYAALRELDQQHLDVILVEQPPNTGEWSAITDRLQKATVPYP